MNRSKERKPVGYYLEAEYPVTVYAAPEGGYVAEIEDLPGCLTEGETLDEVFERIEDARRAWIEVTYEDGADIPLPRTDREYSGKFVVRIAKSLHRRLAEQADREGISLNQHVEGILSASIAYDRAIEQCQYISIPVGQAWQSQVYYLNALDPIADFRSELAPRPKTHRLEQEREKVAA
jgi:antitoxin HicB